MRFRHYIYPVIVFIVIYVVSAVIAFNTRTRIRNAVNYAGKTGTPIIAASRNQWSDFGNLCLFSVGEDPLVIFNEPAIFTWMLEFDDDGTLYKLDSDPSGYHQPTFDIRLSDIRSGSFYPPDTPRIPGNDIPLILYGNYGTKWMVDFKHESCDVTNLITLDTWRVDYENEPPWFGKDEPYTNAFYYAVSTEGSAIVVIQEPDTVSANGKLWRLDKDSAIWTDVADLYDRRMSGLVVGPYGDYISVGIAPNITTWHAFQPSDMVILDGHTGEELFRTTDALYTCIGRRWIVFRSGTHDFYPITIEVLDIKDNFNQSRFADEEVGPFAVYEPPPNGLDGMYENYVPEDDQ